MPIRQTQNSNTPTVATDATAAAANSARIGFRIQNQGTNKLYVLFGTGASTSVYHVILKASTGAADGTGGEFVMMGPTVYTGIVTVAGTNPSYTVLEIAP